MDSVRNGTCPTTRCTMLSGKRNHAQIADNTRGVHGDATRHTAPEITVLCNGLKRNIKKPDSFEKFRWWAKRSWYIPTQFDVSLHCSKSPAAEGRKVTLRVFRRVSVTKEIM